jgi:hypothetical protein
MSEQHAKTVHDISPRVTSLARVIDRLPPGKYTLSLEKPELPSLSWHVEIVRLETVREMEIPVRSFPE